MSPKELSGRNEKSKQTAIASEDGATGAIRVEDNGAAAVLDLSAPSGLTLAYDSLGARPAVAEVDVAKG